MPVSSISAISFNDQNKQLIKKHLILKISNEMKYIYGSIFKRVPGGVQIITHDTIEITEKENQSFSFDMSNISLKSSEFEYSIRAYTEDIDGNFILTKEIQGKAIDLLQYKEYEIITLSPVLQ